MNDVRERLRAALGDRYRVQDELGQGGMAVVFLADDARHDRKVAIKVLRPELGSEIGAGRFLREIKLVASLTHSHILPLYDSGEADGLLFYVMPYIEGESLRQRLTRQHQLPLDDALSIAVAVSAALAYAHRHGILHRDIKPENILLNEGVALVADFGIGKALSTVGSGSLTRTGTAVGTPAYMSPEQASGEVEVDERSDLYSLGCVVYEMLAGEPPFTGATPQAVIAKRFMGPPPRLSVLRDVPEALDQVVTRALARAPVDRYPSMTDFADALRSPGRAHETGPHADQPSAERSIAVLPFSNLSADPENEYFADGMTEEIISALVKVEGLQVASRTSSFAFKGKVLDVREIGEKLGVGTVLEGSVRKAGNRIRIVAQLINVENGYHLWSETYDRRLEDVFAIQDEISRAIVEALKGQLVPAAELVVPVTENLEAYTLYLKGQFFRSKFTEPDLRKAQEQYAQALQQDPRYAKAHAGIADSWMNLADDWLAPTEAYPRARKAAERAIELDPSLAEARTALGKILGWYEWDFAGAERELRQALAEQPNYADAHFGLGSVLPALGRTGEAVEAMRRALAQDPLSALYSRWLARMLVFAGAFDEAIEVTQRTLDLDRNYSRAYLDMGNAYLAQGRADKALAAYRQGQIIEGSVISFNASSARALAAMGKQDEVQRTLVELEELSSKRYIRAEIVAAGYAAIGNLELAFEWLDRALDARSAGLIYLAVEPAYEALRSDERFASFADRVGVVIP
jgi:serine/threonine-protein kinase